MRRLERAVFWLGVAASVGMFVVLVMGARVTVTGSAQGCGRQWPLCQGKFIPDLAAATAIEFSHRAVTGVEGLLIVAFTVAVLALYGRQRPVQVLAPLMFGFLVLQAGMGAWAVVAPQQPVVLALHFGISLIALASTTLTALYVRHPEAMLSAPAVSGTVRLATWALAAYLYVVVYSGAYVRHTGAGSGCTAWPLCGGVPGWGEAVNLAHRFAAAAALLLAVGLLLLLRRVRPARRDLVVGGWVLIATLVAQAAAGAVLVLARWSVGSELLHTALAGLTFTAAAYLCLRTALGRRTATDPNLGGYVPIQRERIPT
jgi:cytochrome c oxidase assembly protein subunit 15